jgi:hypothetical protein
LSRLNWTELLNLLLVRLLSNAAARGLVRRFLLNDLNSPLMGPMDQIINHPTETATAIRRFGTQTWTEKKYQAWDEFNRTHDLGCCSIS